MFTYSSIAVIKLNIFQIPKWDTIIKDQLINCLEKGQLIALLINWLIKINFIKK